MVFGIFKKLTEEDFFKIPQEPFWLAVDFNEAPMQAQLNQKYNFDSNAVSSTIKKNSIETVFSNGSKQRVIVNDVEYIADSFKNQLIQKQIENFIERLKELEPKAIMDEQNAFEWFRVSMKVLGEAIESIDHKNTLLQYKLFSGMKDGTYIFRTILYNLDIEFKITDKGLESTVYNTQKDKNKPAQKVIMTSMYNDYFNELIKILSIIKNKERNLTQIVQEDL